MPNLYSVPLENGVQLTLQNALLTGETSTITFTGSVTAKLQASTDMPGVLVIDRVDANGNETPTKTEYISFTGVTGSTVTGLVRGLANTTDQDHSAGSIVELVPDVIWADGINDTFTVEHNANGTHKTLSLISLGSVTLNNPVINSPTISNSTFTGFAITGGSLASVNISNSIFNGNSINNTTITGASLASVTINNRNYIASVSRSKAVISNASTTLSLSLQFANIFDVYLNGTSKSLLINDVFADSSMTSPFMIKIHYGGTCSLSFNNTINWPGATAPKQTSATGKADTFGFVPSTASVFDGFVVGLNQSV